MTYLSEPQIICYGLLSITEAAAELNYSVSGVRKLVRQGKLRAFQHAKGSRLLFKQEWLDEFVDAGSTPEPPQYRKVKARLPDGDEFGFDPAVLRI